jgi:hypothetical protein
MYEMGICYLFLLLFLEGDHTFYILLHTIQNKEASFMSSSTIHFLGSQSLLERNLVHTRHNDEARSSNSSIKYTFTTSHHALKYKQVRKRENEITSGMAQSEYL